MKKIGVILLLLIFSQTSFAQDYKFGKVSKQELEEQFYPLDSSANAAYLYKKRRTYTTITNGQIRLITDVYVRLKIYNKEGFDWATESQNLYGTSNSNSEKLSNLKAVTYNLENGKIVETKLDKDNVFTEQASKYKKVKKFTMQNLKKGSVVEWKYKIYSPFFTMIDDVVVQYKIPVKKYDAQISFLSYFSFNKRQKGYYPFKIIESSKRNIDFHTQDKVIKISEKNVPAIIQEPYVNNINNYSAALQLEVASLAAPTLGLFENYATSWDEIAKDIFKNTSFGGELKKTGHLKDDIILLKSKFTTPNAKIFGALEYVKKKIKWNGIYGLYSYNGLRKAYKEGVGNIADINLTLVVVLKELGLNASPVLVSTRNHGIPLYPTKRGFNYVIANVKTAEGNILLDASEKYSLPNVLPLRAINWKGTIVKKDGTVGFVNLASLTTSFEETNLNYKITNDGLIEGMNRTKYKNYASLKYRKKYGSTKEDDIISEIEEKNDDIEIVNFRISNLKDIFKPLVEIYKFEKEEGVEIIGDKMYINPLLFIATSENPFKIASREYPVDFGTPWEEKVNVLIQIPEGYTIESLPENLGIEMTENLGVFIYVIKKQGNQVQITSLIKINNSIISANYYQELKKMFKQIVSKQNEKIILTKI